MSRLYVSATQQHDGKTTMSLGLHRLFEKMGKRVHFIKPVGQRYIEHDGCKVDEDAYLFQELFDHDVSLAAMSPVTVPRGFTQEYIFDPKPEILYAGIDAAMIEVGRDVDLMLIEGTGHAGVGSVFDCSNAAVARHVGAKTVIISGGGIGRCIDEVALNQALFEREGVDVIGVIINKVLPNKYEKIDRVVRQGLANQGLECLGVVPYCAALTYPTMEQLVDELGLTVLEGQDHLQNRALSIIVAAMEPQNTISFITNGALVITPGDRVDNILVSIAKHLVSRDNAEGNVSGILLTGGFIPNFTIMELLRASGVPVMSSGEDTYTISKAVQKFIVKIGVGDRDKVEQACELVARHVDAQRILENLE